MVSCALLTGVTGLEPLKVHVLYDLIFQKYEMNMILFHLILNKYFLFALCVTIKFVLTNKY